MKEILLSALKTALFLIAAWFIDITLGRSAALVFIGCGAVCYIIVSARGGKKDDKATTEVTEYVAAPSDAQEITVEKSSRRPKLSNILSLLGLALLLFTGYAVSTMKSMPHNIEEQHVTHEVYTPQESKSHGLSEEVKDEITRKIDGALEKARQRNSAIRDEYLNSVSSSVEPYLSDAESAIPSAVEKITAFSFCADYCWQLAKDYVGGTNNAEEMVMSILRSDIEAPCEEAKHAAESSLEEYRNKLFESENQMRSELEQSCNELSAVFTMPIDNDAINQLKGELYNANNTEMDIAFDSVVTPMFEVLFIKSTYEAVKQLFVIVAEKLTGSAAAAGTCAAADGPLPIGDAIGIVVGVGGTIWSCAEFVEARTELPETLETQLRDGIENYRENIRLSSEETSASLLQCFDSRLTELSEKLKTQLREEY